MNEQLAAVTGTTSVAILRLQPGSAAENAGLKGVAITANGMILGDIIVAINGKDIDSLSKLFARLNDQEIGDELKLKAVNNGKAREVEVTLQPGNRFFRIGCRSRHFEIGWYARRLYFLS